MGVIGLIMLFVRIPTTRGHGGCYRVNMIDIAIQIRLTTGGRDDRYSKIKNYNTCDNEIDN